MSRLEAGRYFGQLLEVLAIEINGKEAVKLVFDVSHRAGNGEWVEMMNKEKGDVLLFLTPAAWDYTIEKLKALGFNGDFHDIQLAGMPIGDGVELEATVSDKGYNRWSIPSIEFGGSDHKLIGKDKLDVFTARMRTSESATVTPTVAPKRGDGIPF